MTPYDITPRDLTRRADLIENLTDDAERTRLLEETPELLRRLAGLLLDHERERYAIYAPGYEDEEQGAAMPAPPLRPGWGWRVPWGEPGEQAMIEHGSPITCIYAWPDQQRRRRWALHYGGQRTWHATAEDAMIEAEREVPRG